MLPKAVSTVVVGAGPAGAVVAARLAEAGEDVLVLEAGPDYGAADSGRWPAPLLDPTLMPVEDESWEYTSSCALGTPAMALQRARVIGGCSSHNGCAAVWGHWSDYDAWAVENPGWSAADLEPLFRTVNEKLRVHVPPRDQITPFIRRSSPRPRKPAIRASRTSPVSIRSMGSPLVRSISIPQPGFAGTPPLPISIPCEPCPICGSRAIPSSTRSP